MIRKQVPERRLGKGMFRSMLIYLLCCCCVVMPFGSITAMAQEDVTTVIEKGMESYHDGDFSVAAGLFQKALDQTPANADISLYIGICRMQLDQMPAAITAFERYLTLAPQGEAADTVRRNLTQVRKQLATTEAQAALSAERAMPLGPEAENTLAVYAFANAGDNQYKHLSRGLSSMIIHDLSQVEKFKLVERIRMQALLDEQALGESRLVSPETATRSGQFLGAGKVIPGIYAVKDSDMKIFSSVYNTRSAAMIDKQFVKGGLVRFWELEKILVFSILKSLGVEKKNILPLILIRVEHVQTKNLAAFSAYSNGLAATDLEDYVTARRHFEKALEEDPDFKLAIVALAALPFATLGTQAIISSMESAAPVSQSGTALAAGSSSKALWIGLGLAGGAGAAAVAVNALNDEGDDSESGQEITEADDLVGSWYTTEASRTSAEWNMRTTLSSNLSFYMTEYINGSPYSGSGTWSYSHSTRYFRMSVPNAGSMGGNISGNTNDFWVDGYWADGSPGRFHWLRQ